MGGIQERRSRTRSTSRIGSAWIVDRVDASDPRGHCSASSRSVHRTVEVSSVDASGNECGSTRTWMGSWQSAISMGCVGRCPTRLASTSSPTQRGMGRNAWRMEWPSVRATSISPVREESRRWSTRSRRGRSMVPFSTRQARTSASTYGKSAREREPRSITEAPKLTAGRGDSDLFEEWTVLAELYTANIGEEALELWAWSLDHARKTYEATMQSDSLTRGRFSPDFVVPMHLRRIDLQLRAVLLQAMSRSIKKRVLEKRKTELASILWNAMMEIQPGSSYEKRKLIDEVLKPRKYDDPGKAASEIERMESKGQPDVRAGDCCPGRPPAERLVEEFLTDRVRLPDALAFRLRLWNERSGMEGQPAEAPVAAAAEVWEAELKELSTQELVSHAGGQHQSWPQPGAQPQQRFQGKQALGGDWDEAWAAAVSVEQAPEARKGKGKGEIKGDKGVKLCPYWQKSMGCRYGGQCVNQDPSKPRACLNCGSE